VKNIKKQNPLYMDMIPEFAQKYLHIGHPNLLFLVDFAD